jgi:hypothetical protein
MKKFLTVPNIKALISILAAIVMYFTPDYIDNIIISLLSMNGIHTLSLNPSEPKKRGRPRKNLK